MSAVGYDQYDNPISGLAFNWTTNIGSMNGQVFTAQKGAGETGFVSAASGLVIGYTIVNVQSPGVDYAWAILLVSALAIVSVAGYAMWRRKK